MELSHYSKYPFDVLPEWDLTKENLGQYEVLLLPDVACLSREAARIISEYVKEGGVLIASGRTSLKDAKGEVQGNFGLAHLFGSDFVRLNDEYSNNYWGSYLERKEHPVWKNVPPTQLAALAPYLECRARSSQVLATHTLPAVALTPEKWIGWRSPGPSRATEFPAVLMNNYGEGKVVYFSFDFFNLSFEPHIHEKEHFLWPKDFFLSLLRYLVPSPKIYCEVPSRHGLGVTSFRRQEEDLLIIHQINLTVSQLKGEVVPIEGGTLLIDERYFRPQSCQVIYPAKKKLGIEKSGNGYQVLTPRVDIHTIITIEGS
jgi:hypothetical protein